MKNSSFAGSFDDVMAFPVRPRSSVQSWNGSSLGSPQRISNVSLTSSKSYQKVPGLDKHQVKTGCLVLGKDAGRGNVYMTRYRINHKSQRASHCSELMYEEVCPCCESDEAKHRKFGQFLWAIIRSEALLFSMHISVIILGAVKESLNLRSEQETLHLIHSVIESVVSLMLIGARVGGAWSSHAKLIKTAHKVEFKDEDIHNESIVGRSLRYWLVVVTAVGIALALMLIVTFLLFYFEAHLGWTLLTNQFALVVITITAGLMDTRIIKAFSCIREDQHKAVICESTLILQEVQQSLESKGKMSESDRASLCKLMEVFSKAVRDTDMFQPPAHVGVIDDGDKPINSLVFNAEMQSCV